MSCLQYMFIVNSESSRLSCTERGEGWSLKSSALAEAFKFFFFFFTACETICSNMLNDIREICESKNTIIICQNLNYLSPVC